MSVRVERDPAFWGAVVEAQPTPGALTSEAVGGFCQSPTVLPLASEGGGFFFVRLDPMGFVADLHTLYRPCAWGTREIPLAGREALNLMFGLGFHAIATLEARGNPLSRPPKSFGFVQAGDWRETPAGTVRGWIVTRLGWEASPVAGRLRRKLD